MKIVSSTCNSLCSSLKENNTKRKTKQKLFCGHEKSDSTMVPNVPAGELSLKFSFIDELKIATVTDSKNGLSNVKDVLFSRCTYDCVPFESNNL